MRKSLEWLWVLHRSVLHGEPYTALWAWIRERWPQIVLVASMSGIGAWFASGIDFINSLGWGAWPFAGALFALLLALAFWAFSRGFLALVDHRRLSSAIRAPASAGELAATKDRLDTTEGDAHERLELFITDYVLPPCWRQIELQKGIIKQICIDEKVLHFAEQGLQHDYMHLPFCEAYDKLADLGGSPAPTLTVREMANYIVELENETYRRFCDQADELAQAAGVDHRRHADLAPIWETWRLEHNHLVEEFDKLKRESRFGRPLYRPQRPSRWGGLIAPIIASG